MLVNNVLEVQFAQSLCYSYKIRVISLKRLSVRWQCVAKFDFSKVVLGTCIFEFPSK